MSFSYSSLTQGLTFEDAEAELLALARDQGIDTSDWVEGNLAYHNLKQMALVYSQMANRLQQAMLWANNSTSSGSALTYLADSYFANTRQEAVTAVGNMIITGSSAAALPKTWAPKQFKVTDGEFIFYNQNQFTLSNIIQYVTESFVAEKAGTSYNISTSTSLNPVETNLGIFVSNPAASNGISGSWLTTFGSDAESDRSLILRNSLKFSSLHVGDFTEDRVKYLAQSASQNNTYVSVDDSQYNTGATLVYLSNDTETATSASVAAAQAVMNSSFMGNLSGTVVTCYAASASIYDRPITIYYSPNVVNPTNLIVTVKQTCDDWVAGIPIGGNNYEPDIYGVASLTDLIHDLEDLSDVYKVAVISSSVDVSLAKNEKLVSPTDWDSVITFTRLTNLNARR